MEVWKIKEISSIDIYENPSKGRGRKNEHKTLCGLKLAASWSSSRF